MNKQQMFPELEGMPERHTVRPTDLTDEFPFMLLETTQPTEEIVEDTEVDMRLSSAERVDTVVRQLGFLPGSKRELNLALGALETRELTGGFGRYLNEVLQHQLKSQSEDPQAALRKIVSEMSSYVKQAQTNVGLAQILEPEFDRALVSPGDNLKTATTARLFDDWQHQAGTRRILRHTERLATVRQALNDWDEQVAIDGLPDDREVAEFLAKTRVGDLRDTMQLFASSEVKRHDFWIQTLRDSRSHLVARPIASAALAETGESVE